ncbi:MAG: hypothetical protein HHJ17_02760 [Rhodoferax sp.]|uniref:hypothetical protein n=1 Tax=Rhodoferax sp. TaxID=50421 RepID=UPI001845FC4A|nr:hypothetical protein [Rhodoferax sp.]NMM12451.1 hypothetical protein [Rhodoferax sp.]
MKNHISTTAAAIASQTEVQTLAAALVAADTRLSELHLARFTASPAPERSIKETALALMRGEPIAAPVNTDTADQQVLRDRLHAGHQMALADQRATHQRLAIERCSKAAPKLADSFGAIRAALESVLVACAALKASNTAVRELGFEPGALGDAVDLHEQLAEPIAQFLKLVSDSEAVVRERYEVDGPAVTLVLLAAHGDALPGDSISLPGKQARAMVRAGRAEVLTNAARLKKAMA